MAQGGRRRVQLRQATAGDAAEICRIYNREVVESTVTLDLVPRTIDEQKAYIVDRSGGLAVVVAEWEDEPDELLGFGSLSFYRDRPGYRTSVEDSVYVDRDQQGLGVGHALLGELVRLATTHGFHTVFARIVDSQEPSLALHERHGFTLVGVEREAARKFGRWHDVALLQRLL